MLTGCIPSKFETVVIKNDIKKAFGTTTDRFNIEKETNTGPGKILLLIFLLKNFLNMTLII